MTCSRTFQRVLASGVAMLCAVATASVTYEYDDAGRLKKVTHDDGMVVNYTLDPAGNRLSVNAAMSPGTVQLNAAAYSGGEASGQRTVTITVVRFEGSNGAASVAYSVGGGTATAGSDYTASNGTLSWASGESGNRTFTITVLDDSAVETPETVNVTLAVPSGASAGTPMSAAVTIASDDVPPTGRVQLSAASYSGGEVSGQRTITITATRTDGSSGAVSAPYNVIAGTATAGSDYTASNGSFNWSSGDAANKSFTITVIDDGLVEANETLTVSLGTPSGAPLGSPTSATVTISSDDNPGVVQLSASSYTGGESLSQRTIAISATRTGGSAGAASVPYTVTAGTATHGSDYTAPSGAFSWSSGDATTKTFTITVIDDTAIELTESLTVSLGTPSGAALGSPTLANVTIFNDDNGPPGTVQFGSSSYSGGEAASLRTITIDVTRIGGNYGGASVPYTITGNNATAGVDFTATNGSLVWGDADTTTKTFTITVLDDSLVESAELINLALGQPVGATLGTQSTASVAIISDDVASVPGTLRFAVASASPSESAGSITFVVSRLNASGPFGAASVICSTSNGSATAGSDYTAVSQTLSWAAGDSANKSCTVAITDDSNYEGNETFSMSLSGASGASLSTPNSATVTIVDNDVQPQPGVVQFSGPDASISESAGSVSFGISRTGTAGAFGAASVTCSASDAYAVAGQDYVATSQTIAWAAGDASTKQCTVQIVNDSTVELDEYFFVNLINASGAALGTFSTITVATIINDDTPPPNPITLEDWSSWQWLPWHFNVRTEFQLTRNGDVFAHTPYWSDVGDWLSPKTGMGNYEVYATGGGPYCGGIFNTWIDLGSNDPRWFLEADSWQMTTSCGLELRIRAKANPSVILDVAGVGLSLSIDPN